MQKILKQGKSVLKTTDGSSNRSAKKLMKRADGKSQIVRHDGHELKNAQGEVTEKTGFDHYQKKSGDGSHVFYDSAKSIFIIGAIPASSSNSSSSSSSTNSQSNDSKFDNFMYDALEFGASIISPIDNVGTNTFGKDSDLGKAIDEINPFNLGTSSLLNDMKELYKKENSTSKSTEK